MIAGVSQGCITPPVGVELSGFRARRQPSTGVHDDLFVRGLYLEEDGNRLLWLHCDLIGFMRDRVQRLRERLRLELGLEAHQVLLTATHTHSGPATLFLRHCGAIRYRFPCDLASQETEILASRDTRSRGAKTPPSPMAATGERPVAATVGRGRSKSRPAPSVKDPRLAVS